MAASDRAHKHFQLYYYRDIELVKSGKYEPLLDKVCSSFDFDFVLIDGNEYTGWAEFLVVTEKCKPKYLALHDTGTLKTKKVETFLQYNADWTMIESDKDGKTGWALYKSSIRG